MRICCIGSRTWHDKDKIREVISEFYEKNSDLVVISGGAPGADNLSVEVAKELGIPTIKYYANWAKWGKAAGPIRNSEMLRDGEPDAVVAFRKGPVSIGTDDCINEARKLGIIVHIISEKTK